MHVLIRPLTLTAIIIICFMNDMILSIIIIIIMSVIIGIIMKIGRTITLTLFATIS